MAKPNTPNRVRYSPEELQLITNATSRKVRLELARKLNRTISAIDQIYHRERNNKIVLHVEEILSKKQEFDLTIPSGIPFSRPSWFNEDLDKLMRSGR